MIGRSDGEEMSVGMEKGAITGMRRKVGEEEKDLGEDLGEKKKKKKEEEEEEVVVVVGGEMG